MSHMNSSVEEDMKASLHEQKKMYHKIKSFTEKITSI